MSARPAPGAPAALPALRLRPMRVSDLDAVMAIEASAYSFPWSRGNMVDSLAASHFAQVLEDGEGQIVGYFVAMPGVDEMHLLNITVAGPWRGRGLGGRLLDELEAHCRERDLATLWLEVRASNEGACGLYRRRGFAEVARRRGYYPGPHGSREDALVMRRLLDPRGASHALD